MATKTQTGYYSDHLTKRRMEAALKRALAMPHQPAKPKSPRPSGKRPSGRRGSQAEQGE
jgi:hypothetical protein